ncbi:MAG TPA: TonB-dependent receptor [Woeseiaceae bacterium]|nr:TonB-dependent receptor [Woeseiaceae bacterium]
MNALRIASVFFALVSQAAQAAPPAVDDVIIVTATRSEISVNDAIVPVTVINRDTIEQSVAGDLADLLRFEAGLDIGRNGGPGQATSLFLRGTESNHTLVLIDGVRMNPGTIGGAALQNIAPDVIERIEIVKGGRSSLYGTDAIGGVVNIITRRAEDGYAEAGVGAGSFDTRSAFTSIGADTGHGEFGVTVNREVTDGYAIRTDSDLARGYDNLSVNLYASRDIGAAKLSLRHWRASGTSEYLDFFLAPVDQDFRNETSALEVSNPVGERGHSKLLLSYAVDDIAQNQAADFVTSERIALDWQYSHRLAAHALAGGVYVTDESARVLSFGSGFDENTDTRAVFLQDNYVNGRQRAFLAARYTDHESFGGEFTWNAEYAVDLGERWVLAGGLGHAFRAPDATDRFGFGGNPDLRPEASDEMQLSARFDATPRQTLRLELYRNDIEDLIEFDINDFLLKNVSDAEIRGAKLGWEFRGDDLDLALDLRAQRAEDANDGSRLLRRPERSVTLRLNRHFGEHALGVALLASSERDDVAETLPGYVLVNLTGQVKLGEHWQLNARLENLLDRAYQTAAPYRMPARSGFVELKYRWQ